MPEGDNKPVVDRIEVCTTDGTVRQVAVRGTRLVVGRAPECEIRLDFDLISRQHAEWILDPFGRWWVRDLGSRNGVKVNGRKTTEQAVGPGDLIRMGKFEFRLLLAAREPIAAAPAAPGHQGELVVETLDEEKAPPITAAHLEGLLDFGRRLTNTADADARRRLLCEIMMRPDFGAIAASVLWLGAAGAMPQTLCDPPWSGPPRPYHVSSTLVRAMRTLGKPVMGSNTTLSDDVVKLSMDQKIMPIAGIACPLRESADTALYVAIPVDYAKPEWLSLAALAATQYRNAEAAWQERERAAMHEAVERELKQARRIQQHYLPKPRQLAACDWHLRIEPCLWVGGDYADIEMLPDGRIFVGVADVCGKGLQAALVGASLHTLIRTALQDGMPLAHTMDRANRYLRQFLPLGSFITMTALLIDPAKQSGQYFNAGHPAPFFMQGDAKVRSLAEPAHCPLGIEQEAFSTMDLKLTSGQTFFLYTDGCTDVMNPAGERLSDDALAKLLGEVVAGGTARSAQAVVDGMFEKMENHCGTCLPPDDRTVMACVFR